MTLNSDNESYRLVGFFGWQSTPRLGGQVQFVYQKEIRPDGDDRDWLSVGARTSYAFTEQFKLFGEVGHDQIDAADGMRKLTRFTLAPTSSPPVRRCPIAVPSIRPSTARTLASRSNIGGSVSLIAALVRLARGSADIRSGCSRIA